MDAFPPPASQILEMEHLLGKREVTLKELKRIEDQLLLQIEGAEKERVEELLGRLYEKREALIEETAQKLEKSGELSEKVEALALLNNFFTSEEMEEQCEALEEEIELAEGDFTAAKQLLQHLRFAARYPIVRELDREVPESTLMSRAEAVAEQGLKEESIFPFLRQMSPCQQREILLCTRSSV